MGTNRKWRLCTIGRCLDLKTICFGNAYEVKKKRFGSENDPILISINLNINPGKMR